MTKSILTVMVAATVIWIISCSKTDTPTGAGGTPPVSGTTFAVDQKGTWSSTATTFTMITHDTSYSCSSATRIMDVSTSTSVNSYVLNGNVLTATQLDTSISYNGLTQDTSISQTVHVLNREGTGSGLQGTWTSSTLPVVTYLKGTRDTSDLGFGNPEDASAMTIRAVFNSDNSFTMHMSMTFSQTAAQMFYPMFSGMAKSLDSVHVTSAVSGNVISFSAPLLPNKLTMTFVGNPPDMDILISYKTTAGVTTTATQHFAPKSDTECAENEMMNNVMAAFAMDLYTAYPPTGTAKSVVLPSLKAFKGL